MISRDSFWDPRSSRPGPLAHPHAVAHLAVQLHSDALATCTLPRRTRNGEDEILPRSDHIAYEFIFAFRFSLSYRTRIGIRLYTAARILVPRAVVYRIG